MSAAGPSIAGPSIAGPSTAGPSTAGPSTAGPSAAPAASPLHPAQAVKEFYAPQKQVCEIPIGQFLANRFVNR